MVLHSCDRLCYSVRSHSSVYTNLTDPNTPCESSRVSASAEVAAVAAVRAVDSGALREGTALQNGREDSDEMQMRPPSRSGDVPSFKATCGIQRRPDHGEATVSKVGLQQKQGLMHG